MNNEWHIPERHRHFDSILLLIKNIELTGRLQNEILDKASITPGLKALIYIGDCFEENPQEAVEIAQQLKLKGIRCFIFHDTSSQLQGYDTGAARTAFDETSPDLVRELLAAIAVYAAQGMKALQQKTKLLPAARLLLDRMR